MTDLWKLPSKWGVDPTSLVKAAMELGIGRNPTDAEVERLRKHFDSFEELSDGEIRDIEDVVKECVANIEGAEDPATYLKPAEQAKYLKECARQAYGKMKDSPLKKKITADTIYETMMNIGVMTHCRGCVSTTEKQPVPIELLAFDGDIAAKVIKHQLLRSFESMEIKTEADFDVAQARLQEAYAAVVQQLRGYNAKRT